MATIANSNDLQSYLHKDPWYNHGQPDAVIAFVRALMEDSEVPWCFPFARELVMGPYTPMTQTLIQHLGRMRDERCIEIIHARMKELRQEDRTLAMPWCAADRPAEAVCIESLAMIGGPRVVEIFECLLSDPNKTYLHETIRGIQIAEKPRNPNATIPDNYPEILRGIHSAIGIMREDDVALDGTSDCDVGRTDGDPEALRSIQEQQNNRRANREKVLAAWRSLPFPGKIEMLSGDGSTRTFKIDEPFTGLVHNVADPFCDFGVFYSTPKIEYPIGQRRWAHSHTFLCYQIPDGSMWNHEYVWDEDASTITTHFRERIELQRVIVNADGKSVRVKNTPIATAIETRGNVATNRCNSAVLGVWDNPQAAGTNFYTRRANVLLPYTKLCYITPKHQPLVNVLGLWLVDEEDRLERFFNGDGNCINELGVIDELLIPLHEPGVLTLTTEQYKPSGPDDIYGKRTPKKLWPELTPVPSVTHLDKVMDARFKKNCCGLAGWEQNTDTGYNPGYDINKDGVIDEQDREIIAKHAGRVYRYNMMQHNYFGLNWLGAAYGCRSRNFKDDPPLFVLSYDFGAGYDAQAGTIYLAEPVAPGTPLYVTYYQDAPAEAGENNIKVYLHPPVE